MAWDDEPPKPEELANAPKKRWDEDPPDQSKLVQGLETASKGLDYQRGATTGPLLAKYLEKVSGKKVYYPEEYDDAIHFRKQYPSSAELYKRAGMPELGSLSDATLGIIPKGSLFDITGRGTVGALTDMGIDPLTWETGGLAKPVSGMKQALEKYLGTSAPARLAGSLAEGVANVPQKVLNAPSNAVNSVGQMAYNRAFQPVSEYGHYIKNKRDVLDTLKKYGVFGAKRPEQYDQILQSLNAKKQEIEKAATQAGGKIDMNNAMAEAEDMLNKMNPKDPQLKPIIDEYRQKIQEYKNMGERPEQIISKEVQSPILDPSGKPFLSMEHEVIPAQSAPTVQEGVGMKSSLYENQQYNYVQGKHKSADVLEKKMARGLNQESKNVIEKSLSPEHLAEYEQILHDYGNIASTKKPLTLQAMKEERKPWLTSVDTMLLGGAGGGFLGHSPHTSEAMGAAYVAKKISEMLKKTALLSKTGYGLQVGSENPIGKALLNYGGRSAVEDLGNTFNPWDVQQPKTKY